VREPLANIIAQTKAAYRQNQSTRPIIDPHYATVSDDSGKFKYNYDCKAIIISNIIAIDI